MRAEARYSSGSLIISGLILIAATLAPLSLSAAASGTAGYAQDIEYSSSGNCSRSRAVISYDSGIGGDDQNQARIKHLLFSNDSNFEISAVDIEGSNEQIKKLKSPFIQRVIPLCTDSRIFTFLVILVEKNDLIWPQLHSNKSVHQLYINIYEDGVVSNTLTTSD